MELLWGLDKLQLNNIMYVGLLAYNNSKILAIIGLPFLSLA